MGEMVFKEHNRSAQAKKPSLLQNQDHLRNQFSPLQIINYEFVTNCLKEFHQFMLTVFQSRHKYLKTSYYIDWYPWMVNWRWLIIQKVWMVNGWSTIHQVSSLIQCICVAKKIFFSTYVWPQDAIHKILNCRSSCMALLNMFAAVRDQDPRCSFEGGMELEKFKECINNLAWVS